ncbi:MAG: VOC family protein [Alphaproteobacteria bacterium]
MAVNTADKSPESQGARDPSGPPEILGIDHVVVRVSDVERALAFYCGVLGLAKEGTASGGRITTLRAGRSVVDICGGGSPASEAKGGRNMDHFALRIEPFDEDALRAYLGAHGVEIDKVGTRGGAEGRGPAMYIHDPDGNMIELKGPSE